MLPDLIGREMQVTCEACLRATCTVVLDRPLVPPQQPTEVSLAFLQATSHPCCSRPMTP
ncbi:hypothetical protein DPMN_017281 [Dreissena polymorpha]|uniref:Uncharacterized protein n=1 Tax=Dreissena polymorpha TaxID=45954 RepID=A0A9D4NB38_DREPO|nr:hypothetical protein DPMN_017281 [Dreissena polymorpha]